MDKTYKLKLLQQAYNETLGAELLKFDCAVLCGGACCRSHAVDKTVEGGMSLLPCEKELCIFDGARVKNSKDGDILLCNGSCDRSVRPFMCRIFPFYAKLSHDKDTNRTKISLLKDPRALSMCPVASKVRKIRASVYFKRHIRRAVRILLKDTAFKNELIKHSDFADSLYELYAKML